MSRLRNSKQVQEAKEKKNKMILSVIISVIMIGSVLGIFVYKDENVDIREYKANDGKKYKFTPTRSSNGFYGWSTEINKEKVFFYATPEYIKNNTIVSQDVETLLANQAVYFTFNPSDKEVQYIEQARFDLFEEYTKKQRYLISSKVLNTTDYPLYPIIDCTNATTYMPVIYFLGSNESKVTNQNSCLIFEGKGEKFLIYRDYIIYKLYGLI